MIPKLEASQDGRKWLKEFWEFLDYYGWRIPIFYAPGSDRTWIEDSSPVIAAIRANIEAGVLGIREERKKEAIEDRRRAEDEVMRMVPEAVRQEFQLLLKATQAAHVFADEHNFYYDFPAYAILRHCFMAVGRRGVNKGIFDLPEDIFYLLPEEVRYSFLVSMDLRHLIKKRRAIHQQYLSEPMPPQVLGSLSMDEMVGLMMRARDYEALIHIMGRAPKVRPELKADLYGVGVSLGVAEGPARVVRSEMELRGIRKGEILVAPCTFAPWTWAFALISGVVTDQGGVGSHTSVVSREYRIPGIVNTFEATRRIKTGQKIRIDGQEGTVYILE